MPVLSAAATGKLDHLSEPDRAAFGRFLRVCDDQLGIGACEDLIGVMITEVDRLVPGIIVKSIERRARSEQAPLDSLDLQRFSTSEMSRREEEGLVRLHECLTRRADLYHLDGHMRTVADVVGAVLDRMDFLSGVVRAQHILQEAGVQALGGHDAIRMRHLTSALLRATWVPESDTVDGEQVVPLARDHVSEALRLTDNQLGDLWIQEPQDERDRVKGDTDGFRFVGYLVLARGGRVCELYATGRPYGRYAFELFDITDRDPAQLDVDQTRRSCGLSISLDFDEARHPLASPTRATVDASFLMDLERLSEADEQALEKLRLACSYHADVTPTQWMNAILAASLYVAYRIASFATASPSALETVRETALETVRESVPGGAADTVRDAPSDSRSGRTSSTWTQPERDLVRSVGMAFAVAREQVAQELGTSRLIDFDLPTFVDILISELESIIPAEVKRTRARAVEIERQAEVQKLQQAQRAREHSLAEDHNRISQSAWTLRDTSSPLSLDPSNPVAMRAAICERVPVGNRLSDADFQELCDSKRIRLVESEETGIFFGYLVVQPGGGADPQIYILGRPLRTVPGSALLFEALPLEKSSAFNVTAVVQFEDQAFSVSGVNQASVLDPTVVIQLPSGDHIRARETQRLGEPLFETVVFDGEPVSAPLPATQIMSGSDHFDSLPQI